VSGPPALRWAGRSLPGLRPLAAGLYLLTSTAWTLGERALLSRRLQPRPWPQYPGWPAQPYGGPPVVPRMSR